MNMKILYFSDGGTNLSVFDSQVLGLVKKFIEKGYNIDLIVRGEVDKSYNHQIKFSYKGLPKYFKISLFIESIELLMKLKLSDYDLIICRGEFTAYIVILIKKILNLKYKILLDVRGAALEELDFYDFGFLGNLKKRLKKHLFYNVLRESVKYSNFISAVSLNLSKYLESKYKRKADIIIPTIVSKNFKFDLNIRKMIRDKYNINEKIVFIYIGSLHKWQCFNETVKYLENVKKYLKYKFYSIILISKKDYEKAKVVIRNSIIFKDCLIDSVPYNEVQKFIAAADFGLLFREDNIVNKVASPVKLSEYLSGGLPVITNMKDYTKHICEKYKDAIIYQDNNAILLKPFLLSKRSKYSEYFLNYYSERAINSIIRLILK